MVKNTGGMIELIVIAGKNTGGSQFFICHNRQNTAHLDRRHTAFGIVTAGLDVVDAIKQGDKIVKVTIVEVPA